LFRYGINFDAPLSNQKPGSRIGLVRDESISLNEVISWNRPILPITDEISRACNLTTTHNAPIHEISSTRDIKTTEIRYNLIIPWTPPVKNDPYFSCKSKGLFEIKSQYKIYDLLGNLVKQIVQTKKVNLQREFQEALKTKKTGALSTRISAEWDYRNERGRRVASGGYLIFTQAKVISACGQVIIEEDFLPHKKVVPWFRVAGR